MTNKFTEFCAEVAKANRSCGNDDHLRVASTSPAAQPRSLTMAEEIDLLASKSPFATAGHP